MHIPSYRHTNSHRKNKQLLAEIKELDFRKISISLLEVDSTENIHVVAAVTGRGEEDYSLEQAALEQRRKSRLWLDEGSRPTAEEGRCATGGAGSE
ncbi:hypothetical protein L1887_08909 [Cichorium endivia]|nr:hypothetical protein L1887_08909 [Cichorium endivia]